MRHGGQVGRQDLAGNVLAHGERQGTHMFTERSGFEQFADGYGLAPLIRNFNADAALTRDWRFDPHAVRLQRQSQIVRERHEAADFDSLSRLKLETRDGRSADDIRYMRLDAKGFECFLEQLGRRLQ